jgi:hypothetical protein
MHPPRKGNVPTSDKRPRGCPFSCRLGTSPQIAIQRQAVALDVGITRVLPRARVSACQEGSFPLAELSSASQSSSRLYIVVEGVSH